jgi:hypothetical protein
VIVLGLTWAAYKEEHAVPSTMTRTILFRGITKKKT